MKVLSIVHVAVTESELVRLLAGCSGTLEDLIFARVRIARGTWQGVFTRIKDCLKLCNLEVMDLAEGRRAVSFENLARERPIVAQAWERQRYDELCVPPPNISEEDFARLTAREQEGLILDREIYHEY